jgi:hypothetical protein
MNNIFGESTTWLVSKFDYSAISVSAFGNADQLLSLSSAFSLPHTSVRQPLMAENAQENNRLYLTTSSQNQLIRSTPMTRLAGSVFWHLLFSTSF